MIVTAPASAEAPVLASAATSAATPTGGGAVVRPSGVALDAGSAVVLVDAGAAGQECCCEAPSFPLQSVVMADCAKVRKGQCVAKTKCAGAADAGAAAPAATKADAGAEQTCCCATGDTKAVSGMSACTKGGKGKCVKAAECK